VASVIEVPGVHDVAVWGGQRSRKLGRCRAGSWRAV